MVLQSPQTRIWLDFLITSYFTCEDTTTLPTTYTSCAPPITDSIDITPEIILIKIQNLQSSKSPGPDGWPIQVIKSMADFISIPLFIIFIKSFNSGSLPQDWKSAHVTPIHKKGARYLVSNYRPVSLTSIFLQNDGILD